MIEFESDGRTETGGLAAPNSGIGPGMLVVHAATPCGAEIWLM